MKKYSVAWFLLREQNCALDKLPTFFRAGDSLGQKSALELA